MKTKKSVFALHTFKLLLITVLLFTAGCKRGGIANSSSNKVTQSDHLPEKLETSETQGSYSKEESTATEAETVWPTARELIESLLNISLPSDASAELFSYNRVQLGAETFRTKVEINKTDLEEVEGQIVDTFGMPIFDNDQGDIDDHYEIKDYEINAFCVNYGKEIESIKRIYFRFGTGSPLNSPSKIFTTISVFAYVVSESDEKMSIYFFYGR